MDLKTLDKCHKLCLVLQKLAQESCCSSQELHMRVFEAQKQHNEEALKFGIGQSASSSHGKDGVNSQ